MNDGFHEAASILSKSIGVEGESSNRLENVVKLFADRAPSRNNMDVVSTLLSLEEAAKRKCPLILQQHNNKTTNDKALTVFIQTLKPLCKWILLHYKQEWLK